jgi:transcriptional regulator with XRE-family HTH domain
MSESDEYITRFNRRSNSQIGQRLAEARRYLRLRQCTVAERLGITRQVISAIETGSRPLKATELATLCNLYRVTPNSILDVQRYGA